VWERILCLEWSTDEDRPTKRLGIEDTSSNNSDSEGLGDEAHTLWLLQYATTLKEKKCSTVVVRG
jgi:hypothetical protein